MAEPVSYTDRKAASRHAVSEHLRLTAEGNIDAWIDLFAHDAILEFPYAPPGVPHRVVGHAALIEHMSNFPKTFNVDFVDLTFHDTVDDHLVKVEFRSEGTAISTGKPYNQQCISVVWTNKDGKIIRYLDYWNPLIAIEALAADC